MAERVDDALADLIERGNVRKSELVDRAGGLRSMRELPATLRFTPQDLERRAAVGELVAMTENGELMFPACQFTGTAVIDGLSTILT